MHVVYLPSWYPAHSEDIKGCFFREQAQMLHKVGVRTGVIAPQLKPLPRGFDRLLSPTATRRDNDLGVMTYRGERVNVVPLLWRQKSRDFARLAEKMFEIYVVEQGLPDIIHVHCALPAGLAAVRIKERYGIPFVLCEHSSIFARGRVRAGGLGVARKAALSSSGSFAVSAAFARLLEEEQGLPPSTFGVVHNPVDERFLCSELQRDEGSGFRFLHVSLLNDNKNVAMLLAAFARAFAGEQQVTLTICGDGPCRNALIEASEQLNISAQVRFTGHVSRDQVVRAMQASSAFVLSSRFETFGLVVAEALASGLPVITTRCAGPQEIVADQDGVVVPVDDVAAMAQAMCSLVDTAEAFSQRVSRRERCRARFAPQVIARKWLDIYSGVIGGARVGS